MLSKQTAAHLLRKGPINTIYRWCFIGMRRAGLRFPGPLIVSKKVKISPIPDVSFLMDPQGFDTIAARLHLNGSQDFEHETTKVFAQIIKDQNMFFDIGAHTGYYSLLAKAANNNIQVHGFEPVPEILENYKNNCHINDFAVECSNIALGDSQGTIEFSLPISINFASGGSTNPSHRTNTRTFSCPTMTLDQYCEKHKIHSVDVMKIDTETTEPAVLRGGLGIIKRSTPTLLIEILSAKVGHEIISVLDGIGYQVYALTDSGPVPCDMDKWDWQDHMANYLFVHDSQAAPLA